MLIEVLLFYDISTNLQHLPCFRSQSLKASGEKQQYRCWNPSKRSSHNSNINQAKGAQCFSTEQNDPPWREWNGTHPTEPFRAGSPTQCPCTTNRLERNTDTIRSSRKLNWYQTEVQGATSVVAPSPRYGLHQRQNSRDLVISQTKMIIIVIVKKEHSSTIRAPKTISENFLTKLEELSTV